MHQMLPNLHVASLGTVLAQGMNLKKKHEVEILAAVVSWIVHDSGAETIIDVGSGQGYLAQALSFQYQHPVIAIDASLHHANVTNARAERIKKHYAAKNSASPHLKVPRTITCNILSSEALTDLSITSLCEDNTEESTGRGNKSEFGDSESSKPSVAKAINLYNKQPHSGAFFVLAGLHACGDLSVNMLRSFVGCEHVRALIGIGCCYNLLSEDCLEKTDNSCGFPISNAAKLSSLVLGKNARDLACQSAERWRILTADAALQNFDVHAFRAAFQLVLDKYFPEILVSSPSIGRQGKALRRQQCRRHRESELCCKDGRCSFFEVSGKLSYSNAKGCQEFDVEGSNNYLLFKEFCKSGLTRLGCMFSEDIDLLEIWKEAQSYTEFIGPFWALRAALGPLVESYILLDRLLFLQEQGNSVEAFLFPIFDPTLSPRNIAVIARRK
uniref:Methyltransferase domain-containing protein n=1 Tax=Musa acuminata subsp. malaccensis TaxID=214687 RepID=A0A804I2Z7_MUSAM